LGTPHPGPRFARYVVGRVGDVMFRSYRIENFQRQIRKAVAGLTADPQIGGSLEVA